MSKKVGTVASMEDCVKALAERKSISKAQAEQEIKDVLNVIADKCVDGGVSFRGYFTISKVVKAGRKGEINGHSYDTPDTNDLKIKVGAELAKSLNA